MRIVIETKSEKTYQRMHFIRIEKEEININYIEYDYKKDTVSNEHHVVKNGDERYSKIRICLDEIIFNERNLYHIF